MICLQKRASWARGINTCTTKCESPDNHPLQTWFRLFRILYFLEIRIRSWVSSQAARFFINLLEGKHSSTRSCPHVATRQHLTCAASSGVPTQMANIDRAANIYVMHHMWPSVACTIANVGLPNFIKRAHPLAICRQDAPDAPTHRRSGPRPRSSILPSHLPSGRPVRPAGRGPD